MSRAQLTDLLYMELMEDAWEYLSGGTTGLEGSGWLYRMPGALMGKAGRLSSAGDVLPDAYI